MTKKNKKTLSLSKELYKAIDSAAYLISKITGQDISLIKSKNETEILQYLNFLLESEKKEEKFLNWRNDKSSSHDVNTDSHGYQMVAKGIYNTKYKAYGTNKSLHDFIKFFSARLGEMAFQRAVNSRFSANLSNPYASIAQPIETNVSRVNLSGLNLQNLLSQIPILRTNDNIPSRGI